MAAAAGLVLGRQSWADNFFWDGNFATPPSGNWSARANWSDDFVPDNNDTATFNLNALYGVSFVADPAPIQGLTVLAGAVQFVSSGAPRTLGVTSASGGQDVLVDGGILLLGGGNNPLHLTVGDDLIVQGGGSLGINAGSHVSTVDLLLAVTTGEGDGTINIGGTVSTLTASAAVIGGTSGATGSLNVVNAAQLTANLLEIGASIESSGVVTVEDTDSRLTTSDEIWIAIGGSGTLNIMGGGNVVSNDAYIGGTTVPGSSVANGMVSVVGLGSTWTNANLLVGMMGRGTIDIMGGADVTTQALAYIGVNSGSTGEVAVDGADSNWSTTGGLGIGNRGDGTLDITGGATVTNGGDGVLIGLESGSSGTVSVDGMQSMWTVNILKVGTAGLGSIAVTNGGWLSSSSSTIGDQAGATGSVSIDGPGSAWTSLGTVYVGKGGSGSLGITDGGALDAPNFGIGATDTSTGSVEIDGPGSICTVTTGIGVGHGTLTITNGGRIVTSGSVAGSSVIGSFVGPPGSAIVDGAGSQWAMANGLKVGQQGNGSLAITKGGKVSIGFGDFWTSIGEHAGGSGSILVDGLGSELTLAREIRIGERGSGSLTIRNGGRVITGVFGTTFIAFLPGSSGFVLVDGMDSTWTVAGHLVVGDQGTGLLTVRNGGTVEAPTVVVRPLGEVDGDGQIIGNVENSGLVSPGTSPGALHIDGDYVQTAAGQLLVELASATSYDAIEVTGNMTLGGTLVVRLIDGFTPQGGQSFDILDFSSFNSGFGTLPDLPALPAALSWDTTQLSTSGELRVVPALPGDYNVDGTVNAADYVVWRKNDGTPQGYNIWRANFGASLGAGGSTVLSRTGEPSAPASVPEPAGALIWWLAIAALLTSPRARRADHESVQHSNLANRFCGGGGGVGAGFPVVSQ